MKPKLRGDNLVVVALVVTAFAVASITIAGIMAATLRQRWLAEHCQMKGMLKGDVHGTIITDKLTGLPVPIAAYQNDRTLYVCDNGIMYGE